MPTKTPAQPVTTPTGRKIVRAAKVTTKPKAALKSKVLSKPKAASKSKASPKAKAAPKSKSKVVSKPKPATPRRTSSKGVATPAALLARVSRAIERELTQIENIVGGAQVPPSQRTEAERRARTLASLARTLREMMQLRAGQEKIKRDDDAVPRDINELRSELARRLDRIVADAKTAHPEQPE